MIILAIDPGQNLGWARIRNGVLAECGLVRAASPRAISQLVTVRAINFDRLVIEKPQVYPSRKQKGDPNDLINVALLAGVVLGAAPNVSFELVVPHDWKGNVPKEITQKRVKADFRLGEQTVFDRGVSLYPKSQHHNIWDAVGLGFWYARKIGERIVLK